MRKVWIGLIFLLLLSATAYADTPKRVVVNPDSAGDRIEVTIKADETLNLISYQCEICFDSDMLEFAGIKRLKPSGIAGAEDVYGGKVLKSSGAVCGYERIERGADSVKVVLCALQAESGEDVEDILKITFMAKQIGESFVELRTEHFRPSEDEGSPGCPDSTTIFTAVCNGRVSESVRPIRQVQRPLPLLTEGKRMQVTYQNSDICMETANGYTYCNMENPFGIDGDSEIAVYYMDFMSELHPVCRMSAQNGRIQMQVKDFGEYMVFLRTHNFLDLPRTHYAGHQILSLTARDIISAEEYFRPSESITRAEFIKLLTTAEELEKSLKKPDIPDLSIGDWYYDSVSAAWNAGIVDNGNFFGQEPILRGDAMLYALRALGQNAMDGQSAGEKLREWNIISGLPDGEVHAEEQITRADAAILIYRMLDYEAAGRNGGVS